MKNPLEKQIQLAICDYLALKKVFFWRQNTTPIFSRADGQYRAMPKYSMNGVSDIIALKNGTAYFLEVKRLKGVQSLNQKQFQINVTLNGGIYALVTSIDDVMKLGL